MSAFFPLLMMLFNLTHSLGFCEKAALGSSFASSSSSSNGFVPLPPPGTHSELFSCLGRGVDGADVGAEVEVDEEGDLVVDVGVVTSVVELSSSGGGGTWSQM